MTAPNVPSRCPSCKKGAMFDISSPWLAIALGIVHLKCDQCGLRMAYKVLTGPQGRDPATLQGACSTHPKAARPDPHGALPQAPITPNPAIPSTINTHHPDHRPAMPRHTKRPTQRSQPAPQSGTDQPRNMPTNEPSLTPNEMLAWRQALSVSQSRAGEMLGISRVSVGKMERGLAPIDRRTELACRWLLAVANWQIDVHERRSWMRALGRWTS